MTLEEMGIIIAKLQAGKPNFFRGKTAKELKLMVAVWYDCLSDLDAQLVDAAVKKYLMTSPYMPEISDIRSAAVKIALPELNDGDDAIWRRVQLALISHGNNRDALSMLPSSLSRAVSAFGIQRLRNSPEKDSRQEFIKFFKSYQVRLIGDGELTALGSADMQQLAGMVQQFKSM